MSSPEPLRDPSQLATLAEEILEEIFLRVPAAADLARSSAACPNFRRVIADHSFLRRFRALHPPPLLGLLFDGFVPAQPPHPSAAAARALAGAADFSCSFLPSRNRWLRRDFRDGRALLSAGDLLSAVSGARRGHSPLASVRELAVCDPIHHRYLLLPVIPDDLAALAQQPDIVTLHPSPFLAPAAEDEEGEDHASFRVLCVVECRTKMVVFIYSSRSGQWHAATFDCMISLGTGNGNPAPSLSAEWSRRYYAHGRFYWPMRHSMEKLLVLDTHSMEFSVVYCPHGPHSDIINRAMMEAGGGRLGMLTLCAGSEFFTYYIWYAILQNDDQSANKWHSEAIIPLPSNYCYNIMGIAGGYLLLQRIPISLPARPNFDCFSLNLKTFELEWFCGSKCVMNLAELYAGFPPYLSAPTI